MTQLFNRIEIKSHRRALRNNMPKVEVILWSRLKGRQIKGLKFWRQQGVGRYVLDFYCPANRLAIELDGDSHYLTDKARDADIRREEFIRSLDITILRFTNTEIYDNLDGVLQKIATTPAPPYQGGERGGLSDKS